MEKKTGATSKKAGGKGKGTACLHPEDLAFNQERTDGSGKWDRICGVDGCGFVMCEIGNPTAAASGVDSRSGEMCTHPVFTRNWKETEAGVEVLLCDCGVELDRRATVQAGDQGMEAAVQMAEASFTSQDVPAGDGAVTSPFTSDGNQAGGDDFFPFDATPLKCGNAGCGSFDASKLDNCSLSGEDKPGCVTGCTSFRMLAEQGHKGDPCVKCGTAHDEVASGPCPGAAGEAGGSPFESAPGPDESAGTVEATGEGETRREVFISEEDKAAIAAAGPGRVSYVTREPHKISPRFQEALPVCVDQTVLAQHGMALAERHKLWLDTKIKLKAFTKASKEIVDKCEREMIELGEIIQSGAEIIPVDCQWEYDFTAGEKALRRCDSWEIVKRETLTVEERQLSLDLNNSSASAIERLREVQRAAAGGSDVMQVECIASVVPFTSICASCLGDCEMDGTPRDPSTGITACTGFWNQPTDEQKQYRDGVCKDWPRCPLAVKCFGPANELSDNTDCLLHFSEFHGVKLQEEVSEELALSQALEELQALLALIGCDVAMEILSQQSQEDLTAAWEYAQALNEGEEEVPAMPFFLKGTQSAAPAGELVGNGYPISPDQVGEELEVVRGEVKESAGFIQDPEDELDPLGAALAEEY